MSKIEVISCLGDWRWRLANLYWIVDEQGKKVKFQPNTEQLDLLQNMHFYNLILKSRQLGFTTLIDILALDQAYFTKDYTAAIIAHGLTEAGKIFRNKVQFPWKNLPDAVKALNPPTNVSASEMVFSNGSSISVTTSARSGTLQFLHISEYGKICRRYPEKAAEIKTGALPAVHAGGLVFVESTADGSGGHYYEMVKEAEGRKNLSDMEFKLHFYPWWKKDSYRLNPDSVLVEAEVIEYFNMLEEKHGIFLDDAQVAWYAVKRRMFKDDMKQEYPSTADEAFSGAMEERYFGEQMAAARRQGRIANIPILPSGVNLFLDLGRDTTAIWFHQYAALQHRMVDYMQDSARTLDFYAREVQKRGYLLKNIYLPHDAGDKSIVTDRSAESEVKRLFPGVKVRVVQRIPQKYMAINAARSIMPACYFHEANCAKGVECLDNYRKKWNESIGNWSDEPVHDQFSHGADAFMQFAQGWEPSHETGVILPKDVNIRPFTSTVPGVGL